MAAIKIQTKDSYIPIEIGDEVIKFHVSDDAFSKLQKRHANVMQDLDSIEEPEDGEEKIEKTKEIMTKAFDFLFEEGAFEKVYSVTPSVMICVEYFNQMTDAVIAELKNRGITPTAQQKVDKYLANKNKKK